MVHAGSEASEAAEQEDHEDVTTKEDARPDGLVSAYWETIGEPALLLACCQLQPHHSLHWSTVGGVHQSLPRDFCWLIPVYVERL